MPVEAIEKIHGEMKDLDTSGRAIAEYLIRRCNEDPSMKEDVAHEKKTMKGCMSFVKSQARKQAKDGVAIIEDKTVFEWAEDYFRQDPEKMNEIHKTATKEKPAKAPKTPEKAENGPKVVETASGKKEPTAAPKAPDRDNDSKPRKKQKSNEVEGQMSLFDFMGAM